MRDFVDQRRDIHGIEPICDVGADIKYAAIHQFGGPTRPHVILHHNKKALAFGGRVVKQVNHPGSRIPARPFLSITPEDEDKIIGKVSAAPAGMNRIENYLLQWSITRCMPGHLAGRGLKYT